MAINKTNYDIDLSGMFKQSYSSNSRSIGGHTTHDLIIHTVQAFWDIKLGHDF